MGELPVEFRGAEVLSEDFIIKEDGDTFGVNARSKALGFARAASALSGKKRPRWVVSDDSGLEVEALSGAPGVRSARYAADSGHEPRAGESRDEANNRLLLEALAGVEVPDRGAVFVCAVACAEVPPPGAEPKIILEVRGECPGTILEAPRGNRGFGYDPLFYLPEQSQSFAELTRAEKNRISHRGRAFRALTGGLLKMLGEDSTA